MSDNLKLHQFNETKGLLSETFDNDKTFFWKDFHSEGIKYFKIEEDLVLLKMKISSQNSIIKEYKYWINILLTIINSNISQHCNHEASIQIVFILKD